MDPQPGDPPSPDSLPESLDDLPSPSTSTSTSESGADDQHISDAEREWRESLQQLELLLTMVLVPYIGKYFGRKTAFWGWKQFMEWKYPVQVVTTDPTAFKATGAAEAASPL